MHELSLASALFELIENQLTEQGFERVNSFRLSCGRLAGVEESCLRTAFEQLVFGHPALTNRFEIDWLPVRTSCFDCGIEMEAAEYRGTCPGCGSYKVLLTGGTEELKLTEMDVD